VHIGEDQEGLLQQVPGVSRDDICREGVISDSVGLPWGRICVDYGKVLNKGFNGVIAEAKAELAKLPIGRLDAYKKRDFLNAVIIACNAAIAFAHRYASLAEKMAQEATMMRGRKNWRKLPGSVDGSRQTRPGPSAKLFNPSGLLI